MKLANTLSLVAVLAMAIAIPVHAFTIEEEHVPNGNTQLNWLTGFNTNRKLIGSTLLPADPAYANPSGDHTAGLLVSATTDSGGIALSCVDPLGQSDYTWEGWFFTGDGSSRRGLVLRADPTINFQSCYQFVLYAGMGQLVFRRLIGQVPTALASWIGPNIPGGVPAVNTWHYLKVSAVGNQFRLWFDATELTAGPGPVVDTAAPLLTGFVGVYNFRFDIGNIPVYFDDLVLSSEAPVPARNGSWGRLKALYR